MKLVKINLLFKKNEMNKLEKNVIKNINKLFK